MLYSKVYYYNQTHGYSDFFRGFGLVMGPLVASNLLCYCPEFLNKFVEIYIIGQSLSFYYTVYLCIRYNYQNRFWEDFKNSFFITMCSSLIYFHPLSISNK